MHPSIIPLFLLFILPSCFAITRKIKIPNLKITKDVIHFCTPDDPLSCGVGGTCLKKSSGNRCKCPTGYMGRGCKRPCQDIYQQCPKWVADDRCSWTRPITPFFEDNCAKSCGRCTGNGRQLPLPLAAILDPVAWMIGKWECHTNSTERFPYPMTGPYVEILDVTIPEVPVFDRPSLNVTVKAKSLDGLEEHNELGHLMLKPFREDTGFAEVNKPATGFDLVAIGLASNTGLMTHEEGEMNGAEVRLHVAKKRTFHGEGHVSDFKEARRTFRLINDKTIEERVMIQDGLGNVKKYIKRYAKIFDYLNNF